VENTHPFTYGCWTFAHNGTLEGLEELDQELNAEIPTDLRRCRTGKTDSELIFLWFLARMRSGGLEPSGRCTDLDGLADLLGSAVRELDARSAPYQTDEKPSRLNLLLTDGHMLLATRWRHTLYSVSRHGVHDCEICGIPHVHHDPGRTYQAVVLASEPISDEEWIEIPERSVVMVNEEIEIAVRSIRS
jgi:glutamine amidotransferase